MALLGEIIRRFRYRLSRRLDAHMAEEMRLHLDLRAAEKQTRVCRPKQRTPKQAGISATPPATLESSRGAWGWTRLESWGQDIRYGLREPSNSTT